MDAKNAKFSISFPMAYFFERTQWLKVRISERLTPVFPTVFGGCLE